VPIVDEFIFRASLASLAASRTVDSSAMVVGGNIYNNAAYPMIATAVFNGSTWSLNTYTLDGIFHQSLGTDLAGFTGLAEKPDPGDDTGLKWWGGVHFKKSSGAEVSLTAGGTVTGQGDISSS
jgi:hypothetical protein